MRDVGKEEHMLSATARRRNATLEVLPVSMTAWWLMMEITSRFRCPVEMGPI